MWSSNPGSSANTLDLALNSVQSRQQQIELCVYYKKEPLPLVLQQVGQQIFQLELSDFFGGVGLALICMIQTLRWFCAVQRSPALEIRETHWERCWALKQFWFICKWGDDVIQSDCEHPHGGFGHWVQTPLLCSKLVQTRLVVNKRTEPPSEGKALVFG